MDTLSVILIERYFYAERERERENDAERERAMLIIEEER